MVHLIASVIGVGIETVDMLVHEVLSLNLRYRKMVARYTDFAGSPDESGARLAFSASTSGRQKLRRSCTPLLSWPS